MIEPKIFWIYDFQVKMMLKTQNNKISLILLSKFPNIVRFSQTESLNESLDLIGCILGMCMRICGGRGVRKIVEKFF